jgi:hypothetical protein
VRQMIMRTTILLALGALAVFAQSSNEPAAITRIEGTVYVNEAAVTAPGSLTKDATVRTEAGRVVIRLRSGTLFVGENSTVRVLDNHPYNYNRLEMTDGSAVVVTENGAGLVVCEDTITLSDHAVVRLDLRPITASPYGEHSCGVKVYEGAASVQLATVATVLRPGKTMPLNRRAGDMVPWHDFDLAGTDDLDHWSREALNR